jgi:hypothetical protein
MDLKKKLTEMTKNLIHHYLAKTNLKLTILKISGTYHVLAMGMKKRVSLNVLFTGKFSDPSTVGA